MNKQERWKKENEKLKANGYVWKKDFSTDGPWQLFASDGTLISKQEALAYIEQEEDLKIVAAIMAAEPLILSGCYPSEEAYRTGHVWGYGHDDDTHLFQFLMDNNADQEEKDDEIRYTFPDGVILIQRDGTLCTMQEVESEEGGR